MYYILGAIVVILIIWTVGSYLAVNSLEEPEYTVTSKNKNYEVRQYGSYIIAETEVSGSFNKATGEGFRIIADYIFGNNTSKESIAMTTPVLEQKSEKIAMTVPVVNTLDGNATKTVSFVLPSKYTLETLPLPNNDRVNIREVEAKKKAVLSFTWYATESRVEAKKAELQKLLVTDGVEIIGETQVARYNPPLSMPLILRNEIIIRVK
jgi:hypothetical protein